MRCVSRPSKLQPMALHLSKRASSLSVNSFLEVTNQFSQLFLSTLIWRLEDKNLGTCSAYKRKKHLCVAISPIFMIRQENSATTWKWVALCYPHLTTDTELKNSFGITNVFGSLRLSLLGEHPHL